MSKVEDEWSVVVAIKHGYSESTCIEVITIPGFTSCSLATTACSEITKLFNDVYSYAKGIVVKTKERKNTNVFD